jgi:predicted GH43/DUF377 family glycosyl hydrolase
MYTYDPLTIGCYSGWKRYKANPVIGNDRGECFDVFVLPRESGGYQMYFSWRSKKSIAVVESNDGFEWSEPKVVLTPSKNTNWEWDVNRQSVLKKDGKYYMWYSGMTKGNLTDNSGTSQLGYAVSNDGINWERFLDPVMIPDQSWEQKCIMCPHVNWNEEKKIYQMYYSAGGWFEPDVIGYAESIDGRSWKKHNKPIFWPVYKNLWERERTTACQVLFHKGWYYMFYIGFEDIHKARVCSARSKNGITNWQRHPLNPIISSGQAGGWDCEAEYKPFLCWEEKNNRWLMWVNGRRGPIEQIGVMIHEGEDLGFDDPLPKSPYE